MGDTGRNREAVKRQDISKLTDSQRKVMEKTYDDVEYARTHSYDDYALSLETRGAATSMSEIDNYALVGKWQDFRFESRDQAVESVRKNMERIKANPNYQRFYNNARNGIALAQGSSATMRALEKKGYIEYVKDGGRGIDYIKIIEK